MSGEKIRSARIQELQTTINTNNIRPKDMIICLEELAELTIFWDMSNQYGIICDMCNKFKHVSRYASKRNNKLLMNCKLCRLVRDRHDLIYTHTYCKVCDTNLLCTNLHPAKSVLKQHNRTNRHITNSRNNKKLQV